MGNGIAASRVAGATVPDPFGRIFTPQQLAELWQVSTDTIRSLFMDEPGVLRFGSDGNTRRGKRAYITLRIPEAVVARVFRERSR
ncbi:MAG TPA: hypothetical protein VN442_01195 [Bryobacteraceae bacterium]|nr:hypothetical protein [Bryobacteraceae bacterium]